MTAHPRTDAIKYNTLVDGGEAVPKDFAILLEDEIAAKVIEMDNLKMELAKEKCYVKTTEAHFHETVEINSKQAKELAHLRKELYRVKEELNNWKSLQIWGGTPEIVEQFIKGQQNRIYAAQDVEKDLAEMEKERDLYYTRAVSLIHLLPENTLCGDIQKAANELITKREDEKKELDKANDEINILNKYIEQLKCDLNLQEDSCSAIWKAYGENLKATKKLVIASEVLRDENWKMDWQNSEIGFEKWRRIWEDFKLAIDVAKDAK